MNIVTYMHFILVIIKHARAEPSTHPLTHTFYSWLLTLLRAFIGLSAGGLQGTLLVNGNT